MCRIRGLERPRLLNEYGGRVTLLTPDLSVCCSSGTDGPRRILGKAQATNHAIEKLGQMARAVRITEWNFASVLEHIHPP
jgi:hypothetical protein